MSRSPAAILFDLSGSAFAVAGNPLHSTGSFGISEQVRVTTTGSLPVVVQSLPNVTGAVAITNALLNVTGAVGIGGPISLSRGGAVGTPLFVSGSVGIGTRVTVQGSVTTFTQGAQLVSGTVNLGNWPAVVGVSGSAPLSVYDTGVSAVSGSVSTYTQGPQEVSGSVSVYTQGAQAVSGTVYVTTTGSFPVVIQGQPVQVTGSVGVGGPISAQVTGSVQVLNQVPVTVTSSLPVTVGNVVQVTGTVGIGGPFSVTGSVGISNLPPIQRVTGSVAIFTQGAQQITGSVSTYTHGAQLVSGTVNLGNWPPVIGVSGSTTLRVWDPGTKEVSGSVRVYTQGAQQVTGSVSVYTQGAQLVSGTVFVTSTGSLPVTGSVSIISQISSQSTTTNVSGSTSTTTILASNPNRLGAMVYNDSNKDLFLKLGSGATTTSFTVKMVKDAYYETPFNYRGIITGVWDTGVSGNARVTEVT